jgi:hypothetical protein
MRIYGQPEDGRRDLNARYARMRKCQVRVLRKLFGPNGNDLREKILEKEIAWKIRIKKVW